MSVSIDLTTGHLDGEGVSVSQRTIAGLQGYFANEAARAAMDQDQVVYRVEAYEPEPEGTPGAVCCATTFLMPGKVSTEYFLTRGHFHANEDRPEMEMTISGEGALILMNDANQTRVEWMAPGSIHHVPPRTAHRAANVGNEPLVFVSWWPSETGHDYDYIIKRGFTGGVVEIDGRPALRTVPPEWT